GEERVRAVSGRAEQLLRAAVIERAARQRQEEARAARARGAIVAAQVRDIATLGLRQIAPPVIAAAAERERAQPARVTRAGGRAERDLALLGKVNPLALEEFAALEERHQFLSTQLEDLKATRRDLLTVIKEVDDRILEVFTSAFNDVAREFEIVFATLFPGGEG